MSLFSTIHTTSTTNTLPPTRSNTSSSNSCISNSLILGTCSPSILSLPSSILFHQKQLHRCCCAIKTSSHDSFAPDLLKKPVVSSSSDEEGVDDDDDGTHKLERVGNHQGERWVDWEDQILEDTVPLVGFVRMILHSGKYQCGDRLSAEHESTILERLLPYHPEFDQKIGCGVDYITGLPDNKWHASVVQIYIHNLHQ